jgi:hypothetical protein
MMKEMKDKLDEDELKQMPSKEEFKAAVMQEAMNQ